MAPRRTLLGATLFYGLIPEIELVHCERLAFAQAVRFQSNEYLFIQVVLRLLRFQINKICFRD